VSETVDHGCNDDRSLNLHKATILDWMYHDLRNETDLHVNLCVRASLTAAEAVMVAIANWKTGNDRLLPRFNEPSTVYDKRTLTIRDCLIISSSVNGRGAAEYVLCDYQRPYLDSDDYEGRMGAFLYSEDSDFSLHIIILINMVGRNSNCVSECRHDRDTNTSMIDVRMKQKPGMSCRKTVCLNDCMVV
jgi:hypothetical protein